MFASGCGAAFVLLALGRAGAEAGVGAVQLELSPMNAETSARAPAAGEDLVHWRGQLWIARESPARESSARESSARESPARESSAARADDAARGGPATTERMWTRRLDESAEHKPGPDSSEFWTSLSVSVVLICVAGLMAGSTLGITGLDPLTLRLKELEGSPSEQAWAKRIIPLTHRHHHMLVTLLLINAVANEALPLFLDRIVDAKTAICISVTCVLFFGEVLPSALMTGPHQLRLAAALTPVVGFLMALTAPISWPISKLLDLMLSKHGAVAGFRRREFKALIQMQHRQHARKQLKRQQSRELQDKLMNPTQAAAEASSNRESESPEDFSADQVTILHSMFDLRIKVVGDLLHKGRNAFEEADDAIGCKMLSVDACMDYETMDRILRWGYSRIPVYRGNRRNILGYLLVKEHLKLDPDDATPIKSLTLRQPCVTVPSASIFDLLNMFQTGRSHLAVVSTDAALYARCWREGKELPAHARLEGLCTIEDVIEEMIGEEVDPPPP